LEDRFGNRNEVDQAFIEDLVARSLPDYALVDWGVFPAVTPSGIAPQESSSGIFSAHSALGSGLTSKYSATNGFSLPGCVWDTNGCRGIWILVIPNGFTLVTGADVDFYRFYVIDDSAAGIFEETLDHYPVLTRIDTKVGTYAVLPTDLDSPSSYEVRYRFEFLRRLASTNSALFDAGEALVKVRLDGDYSPYAADWQQGDIRATVRLYKTSDAAATDWDVTLQDIVGTSYVSPQLEHCGTIARKFEDDIDDRLCLLLSSQELEEVDTESVVALYDADHFSVSQCLYILVKKTAADFGSYGKDTFSDAC
jgi:hypothetical protein